MKKRTVALFLSAILLLPVGFGYTEKKLQVMAADKDLNIGSSKTYSPVFPFNEPYGTILRISSIVVTLVKKKV